MNKIQNKVAKFISESNLNSPIEHKVLDLVSEVGEICKEVLKMSNYGRQKKLKYRKEIELELGDALYSLIRVANTFDVDLEKSLNLVLQKYKKRLKKGTLGSESE